MRKLLLLLVVLLYPAVTLAAKPEQPPSAQSIQGSWQLTALRHDGRETQLPPDLTFLLRLKQDFAWSAEFSAEDQNEEARGVWSLRADVLSLESDQGTARLLASHAEGKLLLRAQSEPDVAMVFERDQAARSR